LGALALGLSGCAVPQPVLHPQPVSKVALTAKTARPMLEGYAKRHSTAVAAGKQAAAAWAMADTGPALAQDQFRSALAAAKGTRDTTAGTYSAGRIWSPRLTAYPMWAVAELSGKGFSGSGTTLGLFEEEHSTTDWKLRSQVAVDPDALPAPAAGTAVTPASAKGQASRLSDAVLAYWNSKMQPQGVDGVETLDAVRTSAKKVADQAGLDIDSLHAAQYDGDSTHLVQTPGGVLAILDYTVTVKLAAHGISWNPPYDKLRGRSGQDLVVKLAATAAVRIAGDGTSRVLGVSSAEVNSAS
ncbi:MAG: hypothetical protein J2O46_02855, partial [Nocardioides sp.]|nr:hypothetical protein [Nocardioides sp.]